MEEERTIPDRREVIWQLTTEPPQPWDGLGGVLVAAFVLGLALVATFAVVRVFWQ